MFGNRGFSPYGTYALGSVAKSGINWSSLLSNTQKTLGIINQAIPAFYQIKPIFSNMKTMFKVVNEINRDTVESNKTDSNNNYSTKYPSTNAVISDVHDIDDKTNNNIVTREDGPIFFV